MNLIPKTKFDRLYEKHKNHGLVLFFLAGLLVDILSLSRIDSLLVIAQHVVYLLIVGFLITYEVIDADRPLQLGKYLQKLWQYREEAIHFIFGALLSAFAIFYFKSASLVSSFLFFGAIVFLLVANELPSFRKLGLSIRFVIFSVCLCSFFCYVVPIVWGSVGFFPFVLSLILSALVLFLIFRFLDKKLPEAEALKVRIAIPSQMVFVVFFVLYVFQLIPPVPLSLKKIGIYHNVTKTESGYELSHEQPWWKIWRSGDQVFVARDGDRIFCFFSVFSPTGFEDQVKVRWMLYTPRGWTSADAIPVKIAGGRDQGFRGFTVKNNFQEGEWQVRVETVDGREIGRLYFDVVKAQSAEGQREFFKVIN